MSFLRMEDYSRLVSNYVAQIELKPQMELSYECLRSLYESSATVRPVGPTVNRELFSECVSEGSLDFYKWLCTHFSKCFIPKDYEFLYENCLLEHIYWTEDNVPQLRKTRLDNQPLPRQLIELSLTTEVNYEVSEDKVDRYTMWLVETGRAIELNPNVMTGLIELLMMDTSSKPRISTVDCLLHMLHLMSEKDFTEHVNRIFKMCQDNEEDGRTRIENLLTLMGQVGILGKPAMAPIILEYKYLPWLIQQISRSMYLTRTMDTTHGDLIFSLGACREELLKDSILTGWILFRFENLDSEVSWIGMPLLRYLLQYDSTKLVAHTKARQICSKMVTHSIMLPSCEKNSRITRELHRLIVTYGSDQMVKEYITRLIPPYREGFLNEVRNLLIDMIYSPGQRNEYERTRTEILVKRLCKELEIRTFLQVTLESKFMGTWTARCLLSEIAATPITPDLRELADHIMSLFIGSNNKRDNQITIEKHSDLIGGRSLKALLYKTWCVDEESTVYERLTTFACENLELYLETVLENFLNGHDTKSSISLPTPLTGAIHYVHVKLVLGTRVYECDGDTLLQVDVQAEMRTTATCLACKELLTGIIYKDSRDNHGIFHCDKCAKSEEPTVGRVSCMVCLGDEDDRVMKIASCGHVYCTECVNRMAEKSKPTCALCAQGIDIERPSATCTLREVAEAFWAEWNDNSEEVKRISLVKSENVHSDSEHDTDYD